MPINYNTLLVPDENQPAGKLWLIRASELETWREALDAGQRHWLELNRFSAKPGEFMLISSLQGHTIAVCGIDETQRLSTWSLAGAAGKLPPGNYRLLNAQAASVDPGNALLGWLLSHYHYDRYRTKTEPHEPKRLLVSNHENILPAVALAEATALYSSPT